MRRWVRLLIQACGFMLSTLIVLSSTASELAQEQDRSRFRVVTKAVATVDGTILKIEGEFYIVEDLTGREVRLRVTKETIQLGGHKQTGDRIRAEITKEGKAVAVQ